MRKEKFSLLLCQRQRNESTSLMNSWRLRIWTTAGGKRKPMLVASVVGQFTFSCYAHVPQGTLCEFQRKYITLKKKHQGTL